MEKIHPRAIPLQRKSNYKLLYSKSTAVCWSLPSGCASEPTQNSLHSSDLPCSAQVLQGTVSTKIKFSQALKSTLIVLRNQLAYHLWHNFPSIKLCCDLFFPGLCLSFYYLHADFAFCVSQTDMAVCAAVYGLCLVNLWAQGPGKWENSGILWETWRCLLLPGKDETRRAMPAWPKNALANSNEHDQVASTQGA